VDLLEEGMAEASLPTRLGARTDPVACQSEILCPAGEGDGAGAASGVGAASLAN